MKFIVKAFLLSLAIMLSAYLLPGVHVENYVNALFFALVLIFLNYFFKPILVFFTIPITFLTLGLFLIVINGIIIILADMFVPGLKVDSFLWAILFSFLISITTYIFEKITGVDEKRKQ